jgi:AraC-like DNA-binding protein
MIEFDFADPINAYLHQQRVIKKAPPTSVIGPQSNRKVDLRLHGRLDCFVVMFQPAGLHQLFSVPMQELADQNDEAHAVLGSCISGVRESLGNSESFEERVRLVDDWLLRISLRLQGVDGVSVVSNRIILCGGRVSINSLADESGLSVRQFERTFMRKVGLRPKLFARIARFEAALENKARFGAKSWTDVAHEFGYYDQMHMNHEFGEFAGGTPTETLIHLMRVFSKHIKPARSGASNDDTAGESDLIL